ncbi:MAG: tRNA uridine-5-carboxymethylaminomethyl(34) synthesis GTPase MnmE, partial [Defluviitaleaceae bacterium]|nr:tRNA uridine-5-carboxymethylaminomethyl(34) synthesis GTPase MnmE [Defluviitaleaceae bacterium]
MNDAGVIAAIATPAGTGAIGIVRLSGEGSARVLSRIFKPNGKSGKWVSHKLRSGIVTDGEKIIDEALAVIMLPPRSYTTEESAEIYSHGGMAATRGVLGAALKNGARPAMPGEFTKRA